MSRAVTLAALSVALVGLASHANANPLYFHAELTHDQEVGVPDEGSSGVADFVLNDARTVLTYDVRLTGLDLGRVNTTPGADYGNPNLPAPGITLSPNDDVLRMHIHRAVAGVNGGIVFGMIDASAALRDDPDDLVIDIPGLHVTGAWDFSEGANGSNLGTELPFLLSGGLYINVHTFDHGGGEIRGQILPTPEPSTLAMFGFGLLGLGFMMRKRVLAS